MKIKIKNYINTVNSSEFIRILVDQLIAIHKSSGISYTELLDRVQKSHSESYAKVKELLTVKWRLGNLPT